MPLKIYVIIIIIIIIRITDDSQVDASSPNLSFFLLVGLTKLLLCFSLLRNTRAIISTQAPQGAIESINGIRVISMCWIILGHMGYRLGKSGKI